MDARIQDLPFDPATLHRLSPGLITSHHPNNDGGAVERLNAIRAQLSSMALSAAPRFQLNGSKREELIATNHGATAMRMRAAGINARYLRGGIDGWQAAGRPTQTKGTST
jgi:rhodanese-related sulfurtransferase